MMKKYAWSTDYEGAFRGEFDTVEEALNNARKYNNWFNYVFIGEIVFPKYMPNLRGRWVIYRLQEDVVNEFGEVAEEWLEDVTKEEEKDLSDMLSAAFTAWAKKYGHMPSFYKLVNIRHYLLPKCEEVR